jgi:hypothetical protein
VTDTSSLVCTKPGVQDLYSIADCSKIKVQMVNMHLSKCSQGYIGDAGDDMPDMIPTVPRTITCANNQALFHDQVAAGSRQAD